MQPRFIDLWAFFPLFSPSSNTVTRFYSGLSGQLYKLIKVLLSMELCRLSMTPLLSAGIQRILLSYLHVPFPHTDAG